MALGVNCVLAQPSLVSIGKIRLKWEQLQGRDGPDTDLIPESLEFVRRFLPLGARERIFTVAPECARLGQCH